MAKWPSAPWSATTRTFSQIPHRNWFFIFIYTFIYLFISQQRQLNTCFGKRAFPLKVMTHGKWEVQLFTVHSVYERLHAWPRKSGFFKNWFIIGLKCETFSTNSACNAKHNHMDMTGWWIDVTKSPAVQSMSSRWRWHNVIPLKQPPSHLRLVLKCRLPIWKYTQH